MSKEDYVNPSYRRPDHPSFQEKRHSLIIDSQGASNREIKTESGTLRFENGVAVLPDDTRAKDIHDEILATASLHPNQYALVEGKPTVNADQTHRYHFGYSRRFADRWEEIFGSNGDTENNEELDNGREVSRSRDTKRGARELHTSA